jgi:phosphatidylglycerol---prolipoprotein diacylglyceryl transferase
MIHYPTINPIAITIGPIKIYWYGIMYLIGFATAWLLLQYRIKKQIPILTKNQVTDLIFYSAIGVVVGGRLGYMLFYNVTTFLHAPWVLFKIWQGGMSFHGGLIGVAVALYGYGRSIHQPFLKLADFLMPVVPIGLGAGRIGNFINGELWGRPTEMPWGMVFPRADGLARHPSQLYEFGLEGVLLFIILWVYSSRPRASGKVSGLFLILYGLFRLISECFRQPDLQLGFVFSDWLTMGQLLSLPMMGVGVMLFFRKGSKNINRL